MPWLRQEQVRFGQALPPRKLVMASLQMNGMWLWQEIWDWRSSTNHSRVPHLDVMKRWTSMVITRYFAGVKVTGPGETTLREMWSKKTCALLVSHLYLNRNTFYEMAERGSRPTSSWVIGPKEKEPVSMWLLRVPFRESIRQAAETQLYAAEDYAEHVKIPKYSEACAAQNLLCIPLVFESFGGMTKNTEETLLRTARSYCHRLSIENSIGIPQMFQRISVVLHRHNGADDFIST